MTLGSIHTYIFYKLLVPLGRLQEKPCGDAECLQEPNQVQTCSQTSVDEIPAVTRQRAGNRSSVYHRTNTIHSHMLERKPENPRTSTGGAHKLEPKWIPGPSHCGATVLASAAAARHPSVPTPLALSLFAIGLQHVLTASATLT